MRTDRIPLTNQAPEGLGAFAGATLGVAALFCSLSSISRNALRPSELVGGWIGCAMFAGAVGGLMGIGLVRVYHRVRGRSRLDAWLWEERRDLLHDLNGATMVFVFNESFVPPDHEGPTGTLTLLTTRHLIEVAMEYESAQYVCKQVRENEKLDGDSLLSQRVLPTAKSVRAIPLSCVRSVVYHAGVYRIEFFDKLKDRVRAITIRWPINEKLISPDLPSAKAFRSVLGSERATTHPYEPRGTYLVRVASIVGFACCWPLVEWVNSQFVDDIPWFAKAIWTASPFLICVTALFDTFRQRTELVVYEAPLEAVGEASKTRVVPAK